MIGGGGKRGMPEASGPVPRDAALISFLAERLRRAILATAPEERPLTLRDFPHGSCGDAALLLGTLLSDYGLGEFMHVGGERGDKSDNTWCTHGWLEQNSLIVDITADQFGEIDTPIIVSRNSAWHATFVSTAITRPSKAYLDAVGPSKPELRRYYRRLVTENKLPCR
jgi:hypothetical protein